jgi:predicted nucleic acid-binding protein
MSKPLSCFTGHSLYLDTMIPYALLRGIDPEAGLLFDRIQQGEIKAYTSVLTFDELAYRLLLALIRDYYEGSPLELLRHEEENMIRQFYPIIAPQLFNLRYFPNLKVAEIAASDIDVMNDTILQYGIKPRDGLHFAAMKRCGCFHMVSHDTDFDRVPAVRRYTLK